MSGRQANGWGECVYCGEMLTPEDEERYSDHCRFCNQWIKLVHIAINRRAYAEKKITENAGNQKAIDYWTKKRDKYNEIHMKLIEALNLKKDFGSSNQECYPQNV
jgi:hypothetical protein